MADPSMVIRIAANVEQLKKNLAEGKLQIETTTAAMSKLASSLSGDKLIQAAHNVTAAVDQIGGASKLTRAEMDRVNTTVEKALDKYRALGQDAPGAMVALAEATKKIPPELNNASSAGDKLSSVLGKATGLLGAFGVSLSVGALVSFGKGLFDMAGSVSDLSEATGVSTTALQQFAYVGVGAGVSMEEIGRSVGTLSERLAGGDQSATGAVKTLGLSLDGLLKAGPEEAFVQISEAVGRLADPMQKNALAADLFGGKLSKQLIPMLGNLRQAMQDVPKEALISPEQMKNADEFGNKIDQLTMKIKAWAATKIFPTRSLELFLPEDASLLRKAQLLRDLGIAEKDNWAATQLAAEAAGRASAAAAAAADAQIKVVPGLVSGYRQGADAVDALHDAFREYADGKAEQTLKRQTEEAAKLKAATDRVSAAFEGYRHIVDGMDQAVVAEIRNAIDHGAAMSDLAVTFHLTEIQAAALTDQFRFEALVAKASAGIHAELATEVWNVDKALEKLSGRALTKIPALQGGANPQLAAATKDFSARLGATLQTELPANIMAAITGGGSVWKAAGSTLGGFLVSDQGIGGTLKKGLTSVLGSSLGGAMSAMLPGIGALAGPLLEKLFSMGGPSEQELAGRTAAANFEKGVAAGLTSQQRAEAGGRSWAMTVIGVRDAYLAVGRSATEAQAAVEAMWAAERQGPEAVAAIQASMQGVIDQAAKLRQSASAFGPSQTELRQMATDAKATYDYMLQAGVYTAEQLEAAFTASQEAQARSLGINTAVQQKSMDMLKTALTDLTQKRDALWQQIAAEAPEAVTGVIEAGARAQLATMDAMIAAQQAEQTRQADAYAAEVEAALASIQDRIQPIIVPIVYDPQPFPGGSVGLDPIPMANGGFGEVTGPTLFLAGEKGRREQVAFSGADQTFADRGFGGGGSDGTVRAIEQLQRTIETQNSRMPQLIGLAVRDAVVGQRGGRR